MTFEEELKMFSNNILPKKKGITTEETTKIALVLPFLKILGYDVENPDELKAEYAADVGVKKSEKIDLAVLIDNDVKMFIECKSANTKLNRNHLNQLLRYFSVSDLKIAILTNGLIYRFFTDSQNPGKMDDVPFLEVDLKNLTDKTIESLKLFTKDNFSEEKIENHIEELKYRYAIHETLLGEIHYPSEEFIKFIAKKVYSGVLNKPRRKYFQKIIKEELKDVFENNYELEYSEINTTDEEIEGFYIVRAILSEIVDVERIYMRDRKSYCGILFDNNQNYTICRFYFNDLDNLAIAFFDSMQKNKNGSRVEEKVALNKVSDIYKYRKKLLETVRVYTKIKK